MELDYLVFIGRFEPFHLGHEAVARHALARARKLIVLVGSADAPRTPKNPWTSAERAVMIEAALGAEASRAIIRPLRDRLYAENLWIADVQRAVADAIAFDSERPEGTPRVGLIGQEKDRSSYYLRAFPQWPLVDVRHTETLSATELRRYYFDEGEGGALLLRANVPPPVFLMLESFRRSAPSFATLLEEHRYLADYRAAWSKAPFPPTFVTADAVLVHSGHVLLIRRKHAPGKGLYALPGGFVEAHEPIYEGCLRELAEECGVGLSVDTLRGALRGSQVFDHPDRSLRGRTITHAFHFDIPSGGLPPVTAGDDASTARFVPVAEALAMGPQLFDDHLHILEYFLSR